ERAAIECAVGPLAIFDLNAVVAVEPPPVGQAEPVPAPVLIAQNRDRAVRAPEYLDSDAGRRVELPVRLPAIHDPGLDLELVAREHLDSNAVEVPRSVRRHIGWLVRPVVEIVVAEQSDVRHEDTGVQIDPVPGVPVISAVRLGDVAIGVRQVPLSPAR